MNTKNHLKQRPNTASQLVLLPNEAAHVMQPALERNGLVEIFRKLYFHLYSNSNASRAERLIENLSLLLLLKLALEKKGEHQLLNRFLQGSVSANNGLMPFLRETFPTLIDAQLKFSIQEEIIRQSLQELSKICISDAPAHTLGEAFQAVMGPRLRGDKGQFFTPRSLVRSMVEITAPLPHESILDPACGTGGFLMEAHLYQVRRRQSSDELAHLVGIDKDHDLSRLATALLQIACDGRASIGNFNSLDPAQWFNFDGGFAEKQFDVILTNPPFGTKIGITDPKILCHFSFGRQWAQLGSDGPYQQSTNLLGSQDPQILFIELCVKKLKPGGRMGIVLPEGVFGNRQQGYVWDWLREQGHIYALLDCPRTTFQPGTDTKTNVLFFRKNSGQPLETLTTRVAVALNCGHDRRGRPQININNGSIQLDDFAILANTYHQDCKNAPTWLDVSLKPYYLVPRYYEKRPVRRVQEEELTRGASYATIGELLRANMILLRKGHEVGSESYGTGDIPFVRTSDLSNFEVSNDPTIAVSEDIYQKYCAQQGLRPGDILMVVDGRYRIGTTVMLTDNNYRCVIQSHLRAIRVMDKTQLDPYGLLFALNLPSVKLRIRDLVFIQTTLGTLGKRLLELEIPIFQGQGAWSDRLESFRSSLQTRDELLNRLKAMSGPEYDL